MTAVRVRELAATRGALMARNAASVLASDVMNRATTFLLYALVARRLGAYAFGQMSLALTFFYASQVLAVAGLNTLLIREAAKRPDRMGDYLRSGCLLVVVASAASLTGVWALVRLLDYAPDTAAVVLVLTLGLFPFALSQVFEAIFQASERMAPIAWANLPVNVGKVVGAIVLLSTGRGLLALVVLLVAAHTAVALVEWLLLPRLPRPIEGLGLTLELARMTRPFLGMEGLAAVMASVIIVLLSKLAGEREVGLYNAGAQLMVPIGLVINSGIRSVFPYMSATYGVDPPALRRTTAGLFWLLYAVVAPAAIGLWFVAEDVLLLLYDEVAFLAAAPVLRTMVGTVVLLAMTAVLGQVLLVAARERTNLWITAVDALASVVLGWVLIDRFGLLGAAAAALLVKFGDFVLHAVAVARLRLDLSLVRLLWRPTAASACLALALTLLGDRGLVVTIVVGTVVYATALAVLEMAAGGVPGLRARHQALGSAS